MKKSFSILISLIAIVSLPGCSKQSQQQANVGGDQPTSASAPIRISSDNTDAAEPSIATAADGSVYVVWVEHRENKEADVMLAQLDKNAKPTGAPVRINPNAGEATAWRGDAPTIAVSGDGAIHVGWTAKLPDAKHANVLYLSTSRDRGRSFEAPVRVNDDGKPVEHGMHSLAVGADNRVYLAWLDERNVVKPAPQAGATAHMEQMEANRDVYFATSADAGRTFAANQRIGREACPCCKSALLADTAGNVFASWRQVLPGDFRHIALAASIDKGVTFRDPVIVSDDRWKISACPVSGPALAVGGDKALRVVWYTEGEKGGAPGIFWAESRDAGATFSESKVLAKGQTRGNPVLVASGNSAPTVIWESNDGGNSRIVTALLAGGSNSTPFSTSGELPSAAASLDHIFIGYIAKLNDRRSIWLARTSLRG